jgi:protein-disulfide isomerase
MSNREAILNRRRKRRQQQRLITIMIVAGVALIALAIILLPTLQRALTPLGEYTVPDSNPRPMADANAIGDPNAPVVIQEFSDFGCSHCADFAFGNGDLIAEDYVATGEVYFVSRSVGNMLNNPLTQQAAEAAYCAGDQNQYWEYHDLIYANQSILFYGGLRFIDNYLDAFAETLGLDMAAFNNCRSDGKFNQQVLADGVEARGFGINGTPSFVINGEVISGNLPYAEFQRAISEALVQSNQ